MAEDIQLPRFALPPLAWILEDSEGLGYSYNRKYVQAVHDVIVIINTSGTTGNLFVCPLRTLLKY